MAQFWQDGAARFQERWRELPAAKRRLLALSAAVSLLASVGILYWAGRPRYAPLYSQLSPEDAGAIIEKLKAEKVAYRLGSSGNSIEVAQGKVHELKMKMATAGLPQSSGPGWELFDRSPFGMSEFQQKLNYQRALQGELTRTIMQLSQVQSARVHLTIPEQSLYEEERKEPSASVVLALRAERLLDKREIQGVVHLVSHAVPGMKPENVTVIDSRGNILSSQEMAELSTDQTDARLQVQGRIERQAAKDVESMLEKALGPGKALVRVRARVDFNRRETSSETYTPAEGKTGVMQEEHTVEEVYSGRGGSGAPPQVPGVAANSPGTLSGLAAYRAPTSSPGGYTHKETTARYQVSKKTEHLVTNPGEVSRMSVAIMVNGDLDAAKKDSLVQLASAAAGLDTARGDRISVVSMPFDTAAEQDEKKQAAAAARQQMIATGMRYGLAVLLMVFVLLVVRQTLRRPQAGLAMAALPAGAEPAAIGGAPTVGQLLDSLDETPAMPEPEHEEPALPGSSLTPSEERLRRLAADSPEFMAKLLRSWLIEPAARR